MIDHQLQLVAIMGGVATVPFVARRLRLPSAALEIVFGLVLFNLFVHEKPEWFAFLKELGFIYLMFIAGMELDLAQVGRSGKSGWYVLLCVLSFTVTPLLFVMLGQSFYLGIAVAMISAGIVIPVLKELELARTPLGRDIVGVALTGEFLSILVLALIDAYHQHGATFAALLKLLKLFGLFGLALVVLRGLYLLAWWHPERVEKVMESEDPVEEGIRTVATVAFAGGLLALLAGTEPILGSFLAGMIFSVVFKSKGRFEEKINALGFGFLIPFFFVGVGAELELAKVVSLPTVLLAGGLTLAVLVSNLYPILLARPLRLSLEEAAGMAVLLSAPLSMIVVAGTLGERMGLIDHATGSALVLTGLFASVLYPSLFRPLAKRLGTGKENAA